jgi:hypothetical protein
MLGVPSLFILALEMFVINIFPYFYTFPGGKMRLGRAADDSPPSNATVMED